MKEKSSSPEVPQTIASYYRALNAGQIDRARDCFSSDATVHDEEKIYRGPVEIGAWIEETTHKYQPRFEILGYEAEEGRYLITARVSGTFPGSPVELEFSFVLQNQRISSLAIA